jgi:hypothetical protein
MDQRNTMEQYGLSSSGSWQRPVATTWQSGNEPLCLIRYLEVSCYLLLLCVDSPEWHKLVICLMTVTSFNLFFNYTPSIPFVSSYIVSLVNNIRTTYVTSHGFHTKKVYADWLFRTITTNT